MIDNALSKKKTPRLLRLQATPIAVLTFWVDFSPQ